MKKRIRALSILFTSIVISFMLFIPQINAETVDDWVYTVDSFNKANGDYNDIIWDMNRNDFRLSGTTFEEDFTGYTRGSQFPNERWRLNFTKSDVKRISIASQQSKYGNKQLYLRKDATWNENAVVTSDFSPTRRGQVDFTVKPSSGHVRVGLYHTPLKLVGESGNTKEFMVRFEPQRGRHKEGIRIGTNVGGNDPSRAAVLFLERKINWGSWYDIRLVWDLDKQSGIDVYVNGTRVARNFYSEMLKNQKNFYFYAIQLAVGTGSPSIEGTTGRGYFDYVRFRETGKNSGTFTSEPLKIPNGIVVDNNSQSINWSQGTSSNSTARVQTSVSKDGGKTWTSWKTVSRGSPVPDIPENTVLNNYQVRYRVTLTRTSTSYNPWVRDLEFNFQNSDKVPPTADIVQTPTSWTNDKVTLEVTNIKDTGGAGYYQTKLPDGSFTTSSNPKFVVTSNGTYSFVIYDNNGNSTTKKITVSNIDKEKPKATISYSSTNKTNKDITITVTATDNESGVHTVQLPNGSIVKNSVVSYTVTKNGSFEFVITDYAGNSTSVIATVDNIDKNPPTVNVIPSTEEMTKGPVIITIIADDENGIEKIVLPDGSEVNESETTYTIEENGKYTLEVIDTVGNKTVKEVTIRNIDNNKPYVEISEKGRTSNQINVELKYGDQ